MAELTEAEKDGVAALVDEARNAYLRGDPALWRGGYPEEKLTELLGDLSAEETRYAVTLLDQSLARLEEREADRVLEDVDAAEAKLAEFTKCIEARGCPPGLTMGQMVDQGYATVAEVEALRVVLR